MQRLKYLAWSRKGSTLVFYFSMPVSFIVQVFISLVFSFSYLENEGAEFDEI